MATVLLSFSAGYSAGYGAGLVEGKKFVLTTAEIKEFVLREQALLNNVCYTWWFKASHTDRTLTVRRKS